MGLTRDERGIATYLLDHPATRNALSLAVLQDIDDALVSVAEDPSVRVLVFTGTGTAFSSGADRSELGDPAIVDRTTALLSSILTRVDGLAVPVVCRVNGAAFGAGLALVAAADVSVAVSGAQFGFPEVRFGLVAGPAAAASVRRMGETAALDLFLTGRRFDAEEARRLGLIAAVVAADDLDAVLESRLSDLLLGEQDAVAATKRVVKALSGLSMAESVASSRAQASDLLERGAPAAPRASRQGLSGAHDVDWRDVPARSRRARAAHDLHPDHRGDLSDLGRCVLTIGTFDGLHRGHVEIVRRAVDTACRAGLPSVLLTFDPHPAELVRPGSHPPVLTTIARRAELATSLGIDIVRVARFDLSYSHLDPTEFVHQTMVERLHAAEVVVGANFRFGHRAAGTVGTLTDLAQRFGFSVQGVELVREGEVVLSSTYLRSCIEAGDVQLAGEGLGRPHRLDGVIEHGDHRGRTLGYPTANLSIDRFAAVPADGVYSGRVVALDQWGQTTSEVLGPAAISIGTNPTFDGQQRRVEAHVLDFAEDLYGRHLGFELHDRLRPMLRFDGADALVTQMAEDVAQTRAAAG